MKIILTLLGINFIYSVNAQTKERKFEVKFGVGTDSHPYVQQTGSLINFSWGEPEFESNGTYQIEIMYKTKSKRIAVGILFVFDDVKQNYFIVSTTRITSFMPAINYIYLLRRKSQLYSEVALGPAFSKYTLTGEQKSVHTTDLGFQFTPFGYRFGKKIAGFVEVGYGYKGLLQLGISGQF